MVRSSLAAVAAAVFFAVFSGSVASAQFLQFAGQTQGRTVHFTGTAYHVRACDGPALLGTAHCHAHIVSDARGNFLTRMATPGFTPGGYSPASLRAAYHIGGTGSSATTVAVVDAYGDPNAEADLAVYRAQYGLPACTTANGCFNKYNEYGTKAFYPSLPSSQFGWAQETGLDLAMVSAICPNCKITLVEASTSNYSDLGLAEDTAVRFGARAISNSYGGCEAGTQSYERYYFHGGVAITVSTGDQGYDSGACGSGSNDNAEFPATSPHVTAVGGTTLHTAANTRGWSESAWSGGGSGCSMVFGKPTWQKDTLCTMRMEADVSAVADPSTPVAVYGPVSMNSQTSAVTSGWLEFGGTSVAAPIVAGIFGVNGTSPIYGEAYHQPNGLNDLTSGTNGTCGGTYFCTAGSGYDGPTGLGSPYTALAF